jgi:hypothetical protein
MLMLQCAYDFVPTVAVDAVSKRRDARRVSFDCQFFGKTHDNRAGIAFFIVFYKRCEYWIRATLNLINGSLSNVPVEQRIESQIDPLSLELSVATVQSDILITI